MSNEKQTAGLMVRHWLLSPHSSQAAAFSGKWPYDHLLT